MKTFKRKDAEMQRREDATLTPLFSLAMNLGHTGRRKPNVFPLYPECLLTPALSSFLGGEGDGIVVFFVVQGSNARISVRGILTPALPAQARRGRRSSCDRGFDHHFESHPALPVALADDAKL